MQKSLHSKKQVLYIPCPFLHTLHMYLSNKHYKKRGYLKYEIASCDWRTSYASSIKECFDITICRNECYKSLAFIVHSIACRHMAYTKASCPGACEMASAICFFSKPEPTLMGIDTGSTISLSSFS